MGPHPGPVQHAHGHHVAFGDRAGQLRGEFGVVLQHRAQPLHGRIDADDVEAGAMEAHVARKKLRHQVEALVVEDLVEIALHDGFVACFLGLGDVRRLGHVGSRL